MTTLFSSIDVITSGEGARWVLWVTLGIHEDVWEWREASLEVGEGGVLRSVCVQFKLAVQYELKM